MNETTAVELQDIRWTSETSKCLLMCITTSDLGAGSSMGTKYVQYRTTSTDAHKAVTLQARGKLSVRNLSPQLTICSSRGSLVVLTCPDKLCQHGECGKLLHTRGEGERLTKEILFCPGRSLSQSTAILQGPPPPPGYSTSEQGGRDFGKHGDWLITVWALPTSRSPWDGISSTGAL